MENEKHHKHIEKIWLIKIMLKIMFVFKRLVLEAQTPELKVSGFIQVRASPSCTPRKPWPQVKGDSAAAARPHVRCSGWRFMRPLFAVLAKCIGVSDKVLGASGGPFGASGDGLLQFR
jgi:hypothetical protein